MDAVNRDRDEAGAGVELVELATGTVRATPASGSRPIGELCAFAARNNSKRGFLIVSKVLGRHMPVKPSVMRRTFADLAAMIPADLPGPVVFIGMAETAICLGQGVHEEWTRMTSRTDTVTIHSTRQTLNCVHGKVLLRFEEPHSHASAHLIYEPTDPATANAMRRARSLVLVDDEISTGTTLSNLATAICARMPGVRHIEAVTLADWSQDNGWLARMPRLAAVSSLVSGRLEWIPNGLPAPAPAPIASAEALGTMSIHRNYGRTGRSAPSAIAIEGDRMVDLLRIDSPSRILVLGTGEFVYPPFRVAEILEQMGHDVTVQATTRSPIHIGGAIRSAITFGDNYGTAVPNFLYNQVLEEGRRVVVCHETPRGSIDPALLDMLGAEALAMGEDA